MSKKKEALTKALLSRLYTETVAVIHSAYEDSPRTVAFVNVDKTWSVKKKLEKAFMLTNTIEDAWYTSDEIIYIGPESSCRSTSVGDMVRFENGTKFKCEDTGWSEV
tara:strand:- start:262 stop:582 length:321 start_codon:yes stop_codon:yes gene_type:complete